ncbi:MAG: alkaline phosphatase family protein, partial [Bacteroidales bacterium]|nr:alkaline phosphatase family protein [Bacteroidales bacterium]
MQRAQKVNRILTTLACTVVAITALSQTAGRPTLVVGITIDQLRSDYIELLRTHFGQGGFNRLLRDGVCISNTTFDLATPGRTAATALIYTGAYPNINGISRPAVYDAESKTSSPIISDRNFIGNNTDETYSPAAIKVSTLSDEVRIDNNGIGQVYAIAPNADQAIIMAGHAANGAFWINDESGKWASSTFYKDFPSVVAARNFGDALRTRVDTMKWTPSMSVN